jgi:hypothetical protein
MNYAIPRIIEDLRDGISENDVQSYLYGLPQEVGDLSGIGGMIIVNPLDTEIVPVATGMIDRDEDRIEIILLKSYKTTVYQNASQAGDVEFLTRVMRGKDSNNNLLTNSIVYIIRKNFKNYGTNQPTLSINWNDTRFNKEGIVACVLTLRQTSLGDQIII